MDIPGKVANNPAARGELNRENEHFPAPFAPDNWSRVTGYPAHLILHTHGGIPPGFLFNIGEKPSSTSTGAFVLYSRLESHLWGGIFLQTPDCVFTVPYIFF